MRRLLVNRSASRLASFGRERGLGDLANNDEPSLTAGCFVKTVNASDAARDAIMIAGLSGQRVGLRALCAPWP